MENLYSRSVTSYCERIGNYFYSEPINAISNLAFFAFAYLTFKLLKKNRIKEFGYWFLFALIILIGVGSSLWHSFRNPFTHTLDYLPIFAFFLSFLYLFIKKLVGSRITALLMVMGFFIIQVIASYSFPYFLNGSIRHVVNAVTFIVIIFAIYKKRSYVSRDMLIALVVYIFAIVFRLLDNTICPYFPVGTHFLWHIFTASAAYFGIKALVKLK